MSSNDTSRFLNIYRRIGLLTCSSVFLLFLFGGWVRATGSGMGCPDWPKCFGQLAPPTDAKDLPADYKEIFLKKRLKKLERFTNTLDKFGLHERAEMIRQDPKMLEPEEFHPVKAWIEYINRLFGVLSGLFAVILGTLIFYRVTNPVFKYARWWYLMGFALLITNAWLGSLVVATNLLPGMVSLHFLLSFLCLFAFIRAVQEVRPIIKHHNISEKRNWRVLWTLIFLLVIMGTWSREQVDLLRSMGSLINAEGILNFQSMDWIFTVHRYGSVIVVITGIYMGWNKRNISFGRNLAFIIASIAFLQIVFGAFHMIFIVPSWVQVLHVVFGSALLTLSYLGLLSYKKNEISN